MNDDRKKPFAGGKGAKGGSGGKGRGPGKPPAAAAAGGEPRPKKPFARQDGAKRAFANREDGKPAKPRPGKWERAEEKAGEGGEPRRKKPFVPRDGDAPRSDGRAGTAKPFRRQDGAKPRPGKWERGEEKAGEGGEPRRKKPFVPRDGDAPRSDARAGTAKPFRRQDGAKPRPGKWERGEEKAGEGGPRKRFARRDGDAPRERAAAALPQRDERIARRLARAGVASRRDAEEMIAAGRITLNGKVLDTPAVNVGANDRIEIDGKPIPAVERTRLFLFHKPAGVVTTSRDPEGRKTVFDVLPGGLPRLVTIGRLDINTEGLLLLTNDGGLSRVLELPATGWLRRYRVRVHGKVEPQALEALKDGIAVDGVFYGAVEAALDREQGSNAWLTIGLREGKNREVKNILGALGLDVTRLIRVSFGPFQLGDLGEGELRELKGRYLRDQLGERLIAESGANFDAPVLEPLAEVRAPRRREEKPRENPRERREARRDDALGRLDTKKPPRPGGKGRSGAPKPGFREERPQEKPRSRTANVWMAPGAKPVGEKKKAALAERSEGRRYAGKPRPAGKPGGKPSGKPGAGRPGPRKPRGER